jgi:hypothetical protein
MPAADFLHHNSKMPPFLKCSSTNTGRNPGVFFGDYSLLAYVEEESALSYHATGGNQYGGVASNLILWPRNDKYRWGPKTTTWSDSSERVLREDDKKK